MKDLIAARYVPVRTLGEGFDSHVHLVRDVLGAAAGESVARVPNAGGLRVALKRVPRELASRALLEFRRLAGFQHPGIPRAYEFGFDPRSGDCFFTCEYLEGAEFTAALGGLPLDDQLDAVAQLLRTLQLVHDRGLLHRDLKPANVLVRRSEQEVRVSLIDFGLADDQVERRLVGSLPYMAPELFDGARASATTDLYALGVMLFELWTGGPPFEADDGLGWIRAHRESPVEFPEDAMVPPSLGRLVRRLLAKDPGERYPSAAAVLTDLSRISVRSLPRETARSLAGRVRSPPVLERTIVTDGGEELDWPSRPLIRAVGSTRAARSQLARELRARMAEQGLLPLHVFLDRVDPLSPLREQLVGLGLLCGPNGGGLDDLLASLRGAAVAFCVEEFERRLKEHDPLLRRLLAFDAPLLVVTETPPGADDFSAEVERSRRPSQVVRAGPWSLEQLREQFPRWVGAPLPESIESVLDVGAEQGIELARVVEVLSLLLDGGALDASGGEVQFHPDRVDLGAADDLLGVQRRRLQLAPADDRALMHAMAVLDMEAEIPELEQLLSREVTSGQLHSLCERGFVVRVSVEGGDRYRVVSAQMRDATLGMIDEAEARRLHGHCAVMLQRSRSLREDVYEVARHRLSEAPTSDAVAAMTTAVERLLVEGRYPAALDSAGAALRHSPGQGDGTARLQIVVGTAQLKSGSVGEAVDSLRLASRSARSEELRERSRLELARALERTGAFRDALEPLAEIEPAVSPEIFAQRAFLHYRLGEEAEAEACLRRADADLPPTASRDRVRVHNTYGLLLHRQQRADEARRQFQRAIELAREADSPVWAASAQHNLGRVEDDEGLLERGYELFRESASVARRYSDRQMAAVFATTEAQSLVDIGRLDEAKRRLQGAREEFETALLGPQFQGPLLTLQARVAMAEGELEVALENADRSRRIGVEQSDDRGVLIADVVRVDVLVRMEEVEASRDLCCSLRERLDDDAPAEMRDYVDIAEWTVRAWFGPAEELAGSLELVRSAASASPKRRADLAVARARAAFVLGRDAELASTVEEVRRELAGTELRDRLALLHAIEYAARVRSGEGGDAGAARRAADGLVSAGHRARRAEALFRIGAACGDVLLLEEAARLARLVRHGPLLSAIEAELSSRASVPASDSEVRRRLRSLEQLKEVTKAITKEVDGERLLRMVLDHAIEHTGARRGFLVLMRGDSISIVAARNIDAADIENPEFSLSSSVARKVAREGKAYMVSDVSADAGLASASSIAQLKLQSILCVPLQAHEPVSGSVYLDDPTRADQFGERDLRYVEDLSDYAAIALEKAQLLETNLVRQREMGESNREIERLNHQLERTVQAQAQELIEVKETLRVTRAELSLKYDYPSVVTRSDKMKKVLTLVDRITDSSYPAHLFGESGTGKELIARCLHANGPRSQGPYFSVNCASFSTALIENELFGHVKGAFTGAERDKPGVFELADGGTLFLDEISDASEELQAKLLRAIQFGEVQRVGSDEVRCVEVRLVSASNRDLALEVQEGRFREDLYDRLNVHRVELPPLRERREDVPLLLDHFQAKHAEKLGVSTLRFERSVLRQLVEHEWRGNVRELENCVIDLLVRCSDDGRVTEDRLPHRVRRLEGNDATVVMGRGKGLKTIVEEFECSLIMQVLEQCNGVRSRAARRLGMSERNLYKKLGKFGLLASNAAAAAEGEK